MSANITDKVTDVRNAARPNSARVTSGRSTGGVTLICDNLAGWPTASKVHFVTYTVDSNSNPVAGSQLDCSGIVSGNNIGSFTVIDGTDSGNSVGDYVEMLPTAAWGQDLADALSVGHTRTGAHVSGLPLTSPVLTTPVITDFTTATHTHASTAQGGQLTGSTALVNSTVTADKLSTGASSASVDTLETTSSASFTDLATPGPAVTVTIGANGLCLLIVTGAVSNNTAGDYAVMGWAASGANTISATSNDALSIQGGSTTNELTSSWVKLLTGLTAGSTTFTAKYERITGGTATFRFRRIQAVPL